MENTNFFDFKKNLNTTPAETDQYFSRNHSYYLILIYLVNSIVISLIFGSIAYIIGELLKLEDVITNTISEVLTSLTAICLALPMAYKTIINDLKRSKKQLLLILLFSVLAFGVFYAISTLYDNHIQKFIIKLLNNIHIISDKTYESFETSKNQLAILELFSNKYTKWIMFPFIGIIIPIYEEIIFRKAMFRIFNFKKSVFNILVSGAIFGAIHITTSILVIITGLIDPANNSYSLDHITLEFVFFFNYFLSGLMLGVVYAISGYNIIPTIIIHILNNSLNAIICIFFM